MLVKVSVQILETRARRWRWEEHLVEDAQAISPQFMLPDLRIGSVSVNRHHRGSGGGGTHCEGPPFPKIKISGDSHTRYFILLFIAFSLKDFFFPAP